MRPTSHHRGVRLRVGALLFAGLLVLSGCAEDPADAFSIDGTGSVEGLVFFDVAEDGLFDPASGDQALGGVGVAVQNRGTGATFAGGAATTDASGRFAVSGLPVGTHDLFVDTLSVPDGVSICRNPLQVTVYQNEPRFAEVRGRAGCLITIAEAKELAIGEFAIVRGIVTSFPGQIESSTTYIQDESAGAKVFSGSLEGQGLQVGDQIEIGGVVEEFSNDFNFESVVLRSVVANVGALSPQVTTTGAIAASGSDYTDPLQGALIKVEAAELLEAFTASGNEQNSTIDDGSGGTTIRVDDGVAPRGDLDTLLTAGLCYDIVGFGANFNGAGQIFPRSLADIVEVPCA
ncbi:MAG: hypothetical protein HKO98_04205 [Gemmatimonadetes bacterium]|nr:hypothetical protein [Gemmatimonadota bacterium]